MMSEGYNTSVFKHSILDSRFFPPLNATRTSFKESFRLMFLNVFIKYKLLILVLLFDGTLLPKFYLSLHVEWLGLSLQLKAESRHRQQKCRLLGSGG